MRAPVVFSVLSVSALSALACASTPVGGRPHDMSAAGHDRMADGEQRAGNAQQQDNASQTESFAHRCAVDNPLVAGVGDACWTEYVNPTNEHREEAKKHRKLAADHRAASQSLRDAETRACAGLSDGDRDESPFHHGADIVSVATLSEGSIGTRGTARVVGATVTFRAVRGLTAEWLQRVVDCHLARNAALGHDVPEMPYCPLVPKGVSATVIAASTGFAVAIRADDQASSEQVLQRARALQGK